MTELSHRHHHHHFLIVCNYTQTHGPEARSNNNEWKAERYHYIEYSNIQIRIDDAIQCQHCDYVHIYSLFIALIVCNMLLFFPLPSLSQSFLVETEGVSVSVMVLVIFHFSARQIRRSKVKLAFFPCIAGVVERSGSGTLLWLQYDNVIQNIYQKGTGLKKKE